MRYGRKGLDRKWGKEERQNYLSELNKGEPSNWDGAINTEDRWGEVEELETKTIPNLRYYIDKKKLALGEKEFLEDILDDLELLKYWLSWAATEKLGAVNWDWGEADEGNFGPRLLLDSRGE